jgi:hypothetical protein
MTSYALPAFVVLLSSSLFATAQAQGVSVGGEGLAECGDYLKARRDNNEMQTYIYATWVRGYVSGYNMATSGTPARTVPGSDTILAYMDKHCQANPLDTLVIGAVELVKELGGTRK